MVIKTSIAFFVPDEEGYPEMLKAVSNNGDILISILKIHE
jgi:hypothetical protein